MKGKPVSDSRLRTVKALYDINSSLHRIAVAVEKEKRCASQTDKRSDGEER